MPFEPNKSVESRIEVHAGKIRTQQQKPTGEAAKAHSNGLVSKPPAAAAAREETAAAAAPVAATTSQEPQNFEGLLEWVDAVTRSFSQRVKEDEEEEASETLPQNPTEASSAVENEQSPTAAASRPADEGTVEATVAQIELQEKVDAAISGPTEQQAAVHPAMPSALAEEASTLPAETRSAAEEQTASESVRPAEASGREADSKDAMPKKIRRGEPVH